MTHDPANCSCRYEAHRCSECATADAEADRLRLLSRCAVLVPFEPGVFAAEPVVHVAMSEVSDPRSFGPVTQTRPANCTCRGDLLPCAFCRRGTVPVPDRINEVVAALAQQPHITQPGAMAVARETPAETRAQIERYNATAEAMPVPGTAAHTSMLHKKARINQAVEQALAQRNDLAALDANTALMRLQQGRVILRTQLAAAEARIIDLDNALAAERLLHRSTQVHLAETRARLAAFVDPDPPATPKVMPANALRHPRQAIGLLVP
jgi:hypothetical protein